MHDAVLDTAQRNDRARKERRRLRQPPETRCDPAAMTVGELLGVGQRAARRHGEDRFAVAWMNAERVAPRAAMAAQPDRIDLRSVLDQKARRFGGAAVKEGASGHIG